MTHEEYVHWYDFQDKVYKLVEKFSEDHHVRYTNMLRFSRITGIPFDERTVKYTNTEETRKLVDALLGPHGETLYKALVIRHDQKKI